ncbi:MAG: YdcF family protein [Cytophagaceae bacterium]
MQESEHLNKIIKFLAKRDFASLDKTNLRKIGVEKFDMLILLGNSSIKVAETAAIAFHEGLANKILISGGYGHSTYFLYNNILKHPIYKNINIKDLSEAEIFLQILTKHFNISNEDILLESNSTNCGSNAIESLKILSSNDLQPKSILIMQDPILQRRSEASFRKVFGGNFEFYSYASFIPLVQGNHEILEYCDESCLQFCDLDRLLSLVMGEIPRLADNEDGYGPRGRNYIIHVDIPQDIVESFEKLKISRENYIRS